MPGLQFYHFTIFTLLAALTFLPFYYFTAMSGFPPCHFPTLAPPIQPTVFHSLPLSGPSGVGISYHYYQFAALLGLPFYRSFTILPTIGRKCLPFPARIGVSVFTAISILPSYWVYRITVLCEF